MYGKNKMKNKPVFLLLLIILLCVIDVYDKNKNTVYVETPSIEMICTSYHNDKFNMHIIPVIVEIPGGRDAGIRIFPILLNKAINKKSTDPKVSIDVVSLFSHKDFANNMKPHHLQLGSIAILYGKHIIEDHRSIILALTTKNNYTRKYKPTLCFGVHFCDCGFNYDRLNKKWILNLGAKFSLGILS
jgi:hypothetical protein